MMADKEYREFHISTVEKKKKEVKNTSTSLINTYCTRSDNLLYTDNT